MHEAGGAAVANWKDVVILATRTAITIESVRTYIDTINAAARMEKLPDLLAEARKQLVAERVPLVHAETYSKQNGGAVSIIAIACEC